MKKQTILVQEYLKRKGLYTGKIDGLAGDKTKSSLAALPQLGANWSLERKIIGAIQLFARESGLEIDPIDGFWKPDTMDAFEQLQHLLQTNELPQSWRPEDIKYVNPNNWPRQYADDFYSFYGKPGENLVKLELPYPHKLSWKPYTPIQSFSCHAKVKDSISRVLIKVLQAYGPDKIKELHLDTFGGCYNYRPVRGGTQLSMHSWGIALDYDPERNQLKWGRDKAAFARPEYNKWWSLWEEEGWISLGRQRNFDWMHVQAAGI